MAGKQSYFKTFIKVSDAFGTSTDMDVLLLMIVDSAIETL